MINWMQPGPHPRLPVLLALQMASLRGSNPGRVVSVPAAMVAECMECLEEIATADMQASRGTAAPCDVRWMHNAAIVALMVVLHLAWLTKAP